VPGEHLVLFVVEKQEGLPRLGLTATRKVGNAVARTRARRQLREAFRHHRAAFGTCDVVINVRGRAVGAASALLEAELLKLIRRARRTPGRPSAGDVR
jgi:ribonuclease P protein component